jgi:hypothetical protein
VGFLGGFLGFFLGGFFYCQPYMKAEMAVWTPHQQPQEEEEDYEDHELRQNDWHNLYKYISEMLDSVDCECCARGGNATPPPPLFLTQLASND